MATANLNFGSRGSGGWRLLPESVPIQAEGYFIATITQALIGFVFPQFSTVSFILAATMFSALAAFIIFYQSLEEKSKARQVLLRAASMLLALEAIYVLYYFSHHLKKA